MQGRSKAREIIRALAVFALTCLLLLAVRALVAWVYAVESPRPAAGLLPGDRVVVSKLSYGLSLPLCCAGGKRAGYAPPCRGSLMALRLPTDTAHPIAVRPMAVARCLALPRDTVYLDASHHVSTHARRGFMPFVVPAKDVPLKVTRWNARLVCNTINLHEPCHTASLRGDTLIVDGHPAETATFTQDYIWAWSGSQSNFDDSRTYGLVPRSCLVGEVKGIVFSIDRAAPSVSRMLRPGRFFVTPKP